MFQCENDLYESKCIKITTTTTTTTTECFLKARQKNSDALKNKLECNIQCTTHTNTHLLTTSKSPR